MSDILLTSITVSIIAISVIFLVLTILIYFIRALVYLLPYEEPSKPAPRAQPAAVPLSQVDEHIPVIGAVMASYLGPSADKLQIVDIQPR